MPRSSRSRRREDEESAADGDEAESVSRREIGKTTRGRKGSADDGAGDNGRGGNRRSKRVRIMEQSGQTDEDRRALRSKQRDLQREIATGAAGDDIEDPESGAFDAVRGRNNQLWDKVRFTREAVLDSDNLELITARAVKQADKLVEVPRYDAVRFSQKLRSKLTSRSGSLAYFDWKRLGNEAGSCFNAVPSRVTFLAGPVDVVFVVKERKKVERRKRNAGGEEGEEERPDEVEQRKDDRSGDKLSAVEQNIKVVSKTLKKRCQEEMAGSAARLEEDLESGKYTEGDEEEKRRATKRVKKHGAEVDAIRYLFNPKSFTQTVENIFHFSFLVKKGDAGIRMRSDEDSNVLGGAGPGPVVRKTMNPNAAPSPKQAIVSLTMKDWRELCEVYSVEEGDIPHRKGSKHARKST